MSTATRERAPQIGDMMMDGTIYAGVSPDTNRPMYAAPNNAPLMMSWNKAMDYAAHFKGHGHKDWRLPTKAELSVLYSNRGKDALKGTFNESEPGFPSCYWSSTGHPGAAGAAAIGWMKGFSNGYREWAWKGLDVSVRLVRG